MAPAPAPELTETQARTILGSRVVITPPVAERSKGCWLFTYDPDETLPGSADSPSWLIYDNGFCTNLGTLKPWQDRVFGAQPILEPA